ncbi:MAG: serine protease Do [Candidatus Endobugula sp.]|jgi:serine protease Do
MPTIFTLLFTSLLTLLSFVPGAYSSSLPDFTGLIQEHSPAVVKIETVTQVSAGGQSSVPLPDNIPEIFRHLFEHPQLQQRNSQPRSNSMGSGFFISEDGYILTNNHVVDGATDIIVRLIDRREFDATIVGVDPQTDLALLKIDADNLPYLELANSEKLLVGEWVLAIGSPFGLDYSVSAGIVSAIGRSIPSGQQQSYVPFIQTDVAINPGNSGGPLFNLDGQVVGINSQIYTNSGGSIGLSFAIPANLAKNVVAQLKDSGRVDRGWLGVVIQDVSKDLALSFGLKKPQGALIAQLDKKGPGRVSGLRVSDIILSFNDKDIQRSSDLPHIVGPIKPGTTVPATVMRKGKEMTLQVTVGSRNSQATEKDRNAQASESRIGAAIENLTDAEREIVGSDGVVVLDVLPNSPAAKAGLRKGDVIVQLGFEDITSVRVFVQVEDDLLSDKPLPIRFIRQGTPVFRSLVIVK